MSCRFVSTSAICLCVISIPAYAQTHARAPVRRAQGVRLTPDGHPDLQGNWTNNGFFTASASKNVRSFAIVPSSFTSNAATRVCFGSLIAT